MKCKLLGFKTINYNKQDGTHVEGINLHMAAPDPEVVGQACKEQYISYKSEFYKLFLPYLSGDVGKLLDCYILIDYNVSGRGANMRSTVVDLKVVPSDGK